MGTTANKLKILAAIPAYNEEKFIYEVASETIKYVDEVVVINDGSTDNTSDVAKKSGASLINHHINKGKGMALNTALSYARRTGTDILVFLDGDGQHNPNEIPNLIMPVLNGHADMVIGSRFMKNNKIPKYRMLGQTVLNIATNIGCGIKVSDSQSGFRALSHKAINCLQFTEEGLAVESEMQFLAKRHMLKVSEVPITTNYDNGLKRSPIVHGFGVLFRVTRLIPKYSWRLNAIKPGPIK